MRVVAMTDGQVLQVPLELVQQSPRLARQVAAAPGVDLESSSDEDDDEQVPTVEVYGQSGPCLHATFEFLHYHKGDPYVPVQKPIVDNTFARLGVCQFDQVRALVHAEFWVSCERVARCGAQRCTRQAADSRALTLLGTAGGLHVRRSLRKAWARGMSRSWTLPARPSTSSCRTCWIL